MITEQTIEQIKRILLSEHEIEQIILFGSQARGDADKNSDIDLLLISKNIQNRFELISLLILIYWQLPLKNMTVIGKYMELSQDMPLRTGK
ncbi:MAG: nucleotidyltransferase domain-containing protein [Ignavibacteriales bacterium]|nr:nucleotidyltransferase domain-containing protein [Ignavibacteriales bacterium]